MVFKLALKTASVLDLGSRMVLGSEFHFLAPNTEKRRSPNMLCDRSVLRDCVLPLDLSALVDVVRDDALLYWQPVKRVQGLSNVLSTRMYCMLDVSTTHFKGECTIAIMESVLENI